jgi:SAM-dependent methyltransferase
VSPRILDRRRRDPRLRAWTRLRPGEGSAVACNVCGWQGDAFGGVPHSESAFCPSCGSIARDRFLHHCFVVRVPYRRRLEVLETSPRLGEHYRRAMQGRVRYRASDFEGSAHRAELVLDLQRLELPDRSLDVVLCAHVLEHVPDPDAALAELHRVLRPDGHVLLQVPVLQGATSVPAGAERHQDETLVHWRFGLDLTERVRDHGFDTAVLVTEDFRRRAAAGDAAWPHRSSEVDAEAVLRSARLDDLVAVADDGTAARHGFEPSYFFLVWDCRRPEEGRGR